MKTSDLKYVMRVMDDHYKNLISRDGRQLSDNHEMQRVMDWFKEYDTLLMVDAPDGELRSKNLECVLAIGGMFRWSPPFGEIGLLVRDILCDHISDQNGASRVRVTMVI